MSCFLSHHKEGYAVSTWEAFKSPFISPYASRHFDLASLTLVSKKMRSNTLWKGQAARLKIKISKNESIQAILKRELADKALFDFFIHVEECEDQIDVIRQKPNLSLEQQANELRKW